MEGDARGWEAEGWQWRGWEEWGEGDERVGDGGKSSRALLIPLSLLSRGLWVSPNSGMSLVKHLGGDPAPPLPPPPPPSPLPPFPPSLLPPSLLPYYLLSKPGQPPCNSPRNLATPPAILSLSLRSAFIGASG